MEASQEDAILQLKSLMDKVDSSLEETFQNVHQGFPIETMVRFLKAREWNAAKAHKMLVDCLKWRIQNGIDDILSKPIVPVDLYKSIRDSQLVGMSGYSREGLPVIAVGVGQSTYDKASVHYYIQSHIQMNEYRDRVLLPGASKKYGRRIGTCVKVLDMTGLKISALSQIKLLTAISTIDDLNYPEKAEKYYIVNAPYIFSSCWKVVKPLLQERTRRKVQVLSGSGKDELLQIMDSSSLPHFCTREGSSSYKHRLNGVVPSCFSLDHTFHQQFDAYVEKQASLRQSDTPVRQGSIHVECPSPDPDDAAIVKTIENEFHKLADRNGVSDSLNGLKIKQ